MPEDLEELIERYHAAMTPFAKGDPKPVKDLYSKAHDVVLANPFGPAVRGWAAASERLDFASSRMHDGEVTGFDEVARYQSGDLFVLHETEYWRSRIADRHAVEPWQLRVTTTFRREDSEWRVVHRHADPIATVHPHGPLRDT
ncbi:MAG: YybH family protein [Gemmatimonadales bacterium]|jgi:ketosteroid isomerase-like protein